MLEPEALGRHKDDLAATLRELRKHAGLTGERVGARCAMSQSKISKIETGKIIPSVVDVERILQALNAPPDVLSEVTALARLAKTEFQDLRSLLMAASCWAVTWLPSGTGGGGSSGWWWEMGRPATGGGGVVSRVSSMLMTPESRAAATSNILKGEPIS